MVVLQGKRDECVRRRVSWRGTQGEFFLALTHRKATRGEFSLAFGPS